jgi:MYXO-CTERM domain-containing protein
MDWDEFTLTNDSTLWGDAADLDGDGRLDFVTSQGEQAGVPVLYIGNQAVMLDPNAPSIPAVSQVADMQTADAEPIVRFAVSDEVTTDLGPRLSAAWVRVVVDGGAPTDYDAWFIGGDLFYAPLPAQAAGSSVEYQACASDRRGNETCADALTYSIEDEDPTTTGDGDGDTTTGDGDGDTSGTGTGTDSGTDGTADGNDEVGNDETGDTAGADEDGGCNCTTEGQGKGGFLALFGLVGLAALRRRRR